MPEMNATGMNTAERPKAMAMTAGVTSSIALNAASRGGRPCSTHRWTFKAMEEVTPAVIAIAFGLSAEFIPVAFISGISGQFYRQFALTISFSTLLSAFNSLTLSPALAALLLQPKDARPDWFSRALNLTLGWF